MCGEKGSRLHGAARYCVKMLYGFVVIHLEMKLHEVVQFDPYTPDPEVVEIQYSVTFGVRH